MRLLVAGQRERRGFVPLQRVASLAGIEVRSPGELPIVLVFVAISATRKHNLEQCVFALGNMTLGAFDGEVFAFERIGRGRVIFRRERRRFEAVHSVASRALRAPRSLGELAVVRIGLVTIHTLCERNRLFEISASVTECAIHGRVFALERILRLRVIKVLTHRSQRNSLPAFGAVAGLTALREASVVWISVAVRTFGKRYPGVTRLAVGCRRVALFTLHLPV